MELRTSKLYKLDGYHLDCPCHGGHESIRAGSMFGDGKIPIARTIWLINKLASGAPIHQIQKELQSFSNNSKTVSSILVKLQTRMVTAILKHKPVFTGADEVEIDEMWVDWKNYDEKEGPAFRRKQMQEGT